MILYVNGDGHVAASEAVVPYCVAEDDPKYFYMGRVAHPDNIKRSFGNILSTTLKAKFITDAEHSSSNVRIVRTTKEFIEQDCNDQVVVLIGWSNWDRVEWHHAKQWWQISLEGFQSEWPNEFRSRYKNWVDGISFDSVMNEQHDLIWDFHCWLNERKVDHLFFNTFEPLVVDTPRDWGGHYLDPYDPDSTYFNWLGTSGFQTVNDHSYHYGANAHQAWANHLLPHLTKKFS